MALQATIRLPGIISLAFPFQGQSITSHIRLAGSVIVPDKDKLPQGTDFIAAQLSGPQQALLLPSHQLFGKKYLISEITYYMDGTAVRQVDYQQDEIRIYNFNDDYLSVFYGDEIAVGDHVFTIVVTAKSAQNPGITVYDTYDLRFFYSKDFNSVKSMLDGITPAAFLGAQDHQVIMFGLDYVLTQRSEGALKNDIDYLGNLYDLDLIPDQFLPYLAKTVGYDYFSGLLGNGDGVRNELRFLPEWQKSVGTKESILVLLRALSIKGEITPLYLDLQKNILITGVKQRYTYADEIRVPAQTRQSYLNIPLTHDSFVPASITTEIRDGSETLVGKFVWDIVLDAPVWQVFTAGWLVDTDGNPATLADIDAIYADAQRGGITIRFKNSLKATSQLRINTTYQYEVEAKPGRNTRLSEFFDVDLQSNEAPNDIRVKDYQHAMEIIKRSKPFRTKMRYVTIPQKSADAFVINAGSVSSTDKTSNPDRLDANNIPTTSTHLEGIRDEVSMMPKGDFTDGFLFSWEQECNLFENRFGLFYSMAIEPTLHGEEFRQLLQDDTLVQRGHAILVRDDRITDELDRKRWLRPVDKHLLNFTTEPACKVGYSYLGHYYTIQHETPVSPSNQVYRDLLIEIETDGITGMDHLHFIMDVLVNTGSRAGVSLDWDGASSLVSTDLATAIATPVTFDVDTPNTKAYSGIYGDTSFVLLLFRPTSQADIQAIWSARPNLNNYPMTIGAWYAIWDIASDFNTNPIHLSVLSPTALLNHQGTCCDDCLIGIFEPESHSSDPGWFNWGMFNDVIFNEVTSVGSTVNFSQIIGKTYQFGYEFDLEIFSFSTNEVFAIYRWNSGSWVTIQSNPYIDVTLQPANNGLLTDNLVIEGEVGYSGPPVTGVSQQWGIRACFKKVGDRMEIGLGQRFVDDFGLAEVHGGRSGIIDDSARFLGVGWKDLIPHQHNQGGQRNAAFDGFYLRGGDLRSCLTYKVTIGSPTVLTWDASTWDQESAWDFASQFQWDVDFWDQVDRTWDPTAAVPASFTVHHFPNRQVFELV